MEKEYNFITEETQEMLEQFARTQNSCRTRVEYKNAIKLLCEKLLMKEMSFGLRLPVLFVVCRYHFF